MRGILRVTWVAGLCLGCEIPPLPAPSDASAPSAPPPRVYEGRRAGQWASTVVPSGERIRSTARDPGGQPVTDAHALSPGQTVHVEWHGWWFEARVIRVIDASTVHVHRVGYPPARDGDEPVSKLRVGAVITDAMADTHYRSGT
jgi:hypothetical protein